MSRKTATLTGILGGIVMLGAGVAHAQAEGEASPCVQEGHSFSCSVEIEQTIPSEGESTTKSSGESSFESTVETTTEKAQKKASKKAQEKVSKKASKKAPKKAAEKATANAPKNATATSRQQVEGTWECEGDQKKSFKDGKSVLKTEMNCSSDVTP